MAQSTVHRHRAAAAAGLAADAPVVETTTAAVQSTLRREQIDVLPLAGRDYTNAIRLVPGAAANNSSYGFGGSRGRSNTFNVDGVDNSDEISGYAHQSPALDSIQEIQVLVSVRLTCAATDTGSPALPASIFVEGEALHDQQTERALARMRAVFVDAALPLGAQTAWAPTAPKGNGLRSGATPCSAVLAVGRPSGSTFGKGVRGGSTRFDRLDANAVVDASGVSLSQVVIVMQLIY